MFHISLQYSYLPLQSTHISLPFLKCSVFGKKKLFFYEETIQNFNFSIFCKTCARPKQTYADKTRCETKKTKQIMRTIEKKTLRGTAKVTQKDRIRNTIIKEDCGIEVVVNCVRKRRRYWRDHVERMDNGRLVKQMTTE